MSRVNPTVIPRNHLVQRAIELAESGEVAWIQKMVARAAHPYDWQEGDLEWARIPEAEERVTRTFCGT
jgi:uncharacterized protein YdiU (UPF0061 family)